MLIYSFNCTKETLFYDKNKYYAFHLFLLNVICYWVRVKMILVIFNNISVISCRSVLLWEETRVPEKTTACQKSLTNSCIPLRAQRLKLATFAVIHTDSIDSCKSNYHTITTKTACICKWYIMFVIVFSVHFFSFGTVGVMQDRTKYVYLFINFCLIYQYPNDLHKTVLVLAMSLIDLPQNVPDVPPTCVCTVPSV